jgi:hypothetical protein
MNEFESFRSLGYPINYTFNEKFFLSNFEVDQGQLFYKNVAVERIKWSIKSLDVTLFDIYLVSMIIKFDNYADWSFFIGKVVRDKVYVQYFTED